MRANQLLRACFWVALFSSLAGAETPPSEGLRSYFQAKEALDQGIQAIGGVEALQAVRTVSRQLSGDWFGSGQTPRPYPLSGPTLATPPSNGRSQIMSFIDYGKGRWLEETVESDFSGDFIVRITAVGEDKGFETLTYRDEKPYYRVFSAPDLPSIRLRRLRRYPEGLLRMALERPETLEWVGMGEEFGRLLGLSGDYRDATWVNFDNDGEVSVHISQNDYLEYREPLAFDKLCASLGQVFIDFFDLYKKGEGVRAIDGSLVKP